uniref:Ig-like domain-containing protein n=1 Tax=Myotis lucifugus TaxID=59463 RepID=G1NZP5_MYOLU
LLVFLLTFWIPPTTARFGIVLTIALEGQDVILRTQNRPPGVTGFVWYRGKEMNYYTLIASLTLHSRRLLRGPEYRGRETVNLDGSLTIRKVTVRDLGMYILVAVLQNLYSKYTVSECSLTSRCPNCQLWTLLHPPLHHVPSWVWTFSAGHTVETNFLSWGSTLRATSGNLGEFRETSASQGKSRRKDAPGSCSSTRDQPRTIRVRGTLSVPTLLASNTTVTENEDTVFMTCYTDESSTNWLFNATSLGLRERMKLSQDHRTLTIDPVRRKDSGNYQCKVSNPVSSTESAPVELDVKY